MVSHASVGRVAVVAAFALGCGADPAADAGARVAPEGGTRATPNATDGGGRGGTSNSTPAGQGSIDTGSSSAGTESTTCATLSARGVLIKEPVDIILVLDNSGSMADELDAVERNINLNFAKILSESGVDYRVILLSRHRREERAPSGESSTSICVTSPLSGLATCPGPEPVNSERFFQYSIKVESEDSLDRILSTYNQADSKFGLTELGWSEWLRSGAKKVFLELTDDNAEMPVDAFVQKLTALLPANFGSESRPEFVFHSIIGIKEKSPASAPYAPDEPIQTARCSGGGDTVANAGLGYQELSRRTGGLRFPICEFSSYDAVFRTIASDVVTHSQLSCDFDIPALADGGALDPTRVAVAYSAAGASSAARFGQVLDLAACQADAFYIEDEQIHLCPDTCNAVKADSSAKIDVLFTCESTIIVK